jgi:hypothetical protein
MKSLNGKIKTHFDSKLVTSIKTKLCSVIDLFCFRLEVEITWQSKRLQH